MTTLFSSFILILFSSLCFASEAPFQWCVANAAFQVEGSPGDSDWSRFTHAPGNIEDGSNADQALDFWNSYDTEFDRAKELGVRSFRLSVAWERIEPQPGVWDDTALAHYETMILALRARGLEPIVTLHHFVLPGWLADRGGLTAAEFPKDFGVFAERVVRRLALGPAHVKWWLTFNEPAILVHSAYIDGSWPPGRKNDFSAATLALAQMARAHFEAVRRIRSLGGPDKIQISFAKHWRPFEPVSAGLMDRLAAKIADWVFNRQVLNAFVYGKVFFWIPGGKLIWETLTLPPGEKSVDYLAANYYGRLMVGFKPSAPFVNVTEGPGPKNDLGWEINADSLDQVIEGAKQMGLPLLISENGVADSTDHLRASFIRDHVRVLENAQRQGAQILGYCHWTLTDNFEWAKGFSAKFGLVSFDPKTRQRLPRPSFYEFQKLIKG